MRELRSLNLSDTFGVTGRGLKALSGLSHLRSLDMTMSGVSDEGSGGHSGPQRSAIS